MKEITKEEVNFNSPKDVYKYSMFVYSKFLLGDNLKALNEYLEGIEDIEFKDYNTWTWIEPLISLKSHLNQSNPEIQFECRNKIKQILSVGNEIQVQVKNRVFQRVLNGEAQFDELILQAKESKDEVLIFESIMKSIMQLITIIEMGASQEFTLEMAKKKLALLKSEALDYI